MKDENWERLSALAAGALTYRLHANGNYYTLYLDRLNVQYTPNDVHWFDYDAHQVNEDWLCNGVLLVDYNIVKDDDSTWQARVRIGAPVDDGEPLRIVNVSIQGDDIETTALPLAQIRRGCIAVGGVSGRWTTKKTSSGEMTTYTITDNGSGVPVHPDEVSALVDGKKRERGHHQQQAVLRRVYEAVIEYERLNADLDNDDRPTNKKEYVAKKTGLPVSNIARDIKRAMELHAQVTDKNKKRKTK